MNRDPSRQLTVIPVAGSRITRDFLELPWSIYAGDPAWVAPLRLERRLHLSRFNPFLEHGEWQGWVAYLDGQPAGRITAQIDRLHRVRYGGHTGHFGSLEGLDDETVFSALFAAAEQWLRERGTELVSGPFNFSINQDCGALVEGFQHPPVLMMPHNRRWYGARIEEQGYRRARDLLAYWVRLDFDEPPAMRQLLRRYGPKVLIRPLRRAQLAAELELLRDLFNDAWSENWGFVPFTREEFADLGRTLRLLLPDNLVQIAELDGCAVAFIVALPNLNEILRDLNGALFPLGWWRIWRALRQRRIRTGRVPLMGVRRQYQNSPMGIALAYLVSDAVRQSLRAYGIREVEMSWILEDNQGMRSMLESIGSTLYKRYRIFEKTLPAQTTRAAPAAC